jgi:YbbR domain-containing protein
VNISGARSDVVRSVAIPLPSGVEFVGRDRATISVEIEPLRGRVRTAAALAAEGLPDNRSINFAEPNVTIVLEGSLPELNAIVGDLEALVDVSELGVGTFEVPILVPLPEGVSIVSMQPESVTVTISEP